MNNKKGQVEDWLPMILIIVVFIFIFLFLLFPDKSQQEKKELAKFESLDIEAEKILINFLRHDYKYKNVDISVGGAIQLYVNMQDANILEDISSIAEDFFSKTKLKTDSITWSLEIQDEINKKVINGMSDFPINPDIIYERKETLAEVMIPNYVGAPIEVRLLIIYQK